MHTCKSLMAKSLIILSLIGLVGCVQSTGSPAKPTDKDRGTTTAIPPSNSRVISTDDETLIEYKALPGDGGGCMADYLGYDAPEFVLYDDGLLLVNSPDEHSWYNQSTLNSQEIDALLQQIENTGFFSADGDGREYEDDPIYQFTQNPDPSMGAGSIYFSARQGDLVKEVTIYALWLDYVVPEVAEAMQVIMDYHPEDSTAYLPNTWVAWVEDSDPCESYQLEYLPWPAEAPLISSSMNGAAHRQFFFENSAEYSYSQVFGSKPGTFKVVENGMIYYILSRPLLPHELTSDFQDY